MAYTLADVAEPPVKKVYKLEDVAPAAEQNPNAFNPAEGFSALKTVKNIPGSAKDLAGNIITAVRHPIETVKAVGNAAIGGIEKLVPGQQEDEKAFDAVTSFFKQRYGGVDNLKKTVQEDPVGFAADVATVLSGAGGAVGKAGEIASAAKLGAVGEATAGAMMKAGSVISKAGEFVDPIMAPIKAAGAVGDLAGEGIAKLAPQILGKTTGTGAETISEALRNPGPEFKKALRGETTGEDILSTAKDALGAIKEERAARYSKQLEKISAQQKQLDVNPILDKLVDEMDNFRIKAIKNRSGKLNLDFSRSTISDPVEANKVSDLVATLSDWGSQPGDKTPLGLDLLKRRLDDFYSPSGQARKLVTSVRSKVKSILDENVKGYAEMTGDYEKTSNLVKDIEKGLSLSDRTSADTSIRKLTSVLRQNNEFRDALVGQLEKTGVDLKGMIAGNQMNPALPRGLMGVAVGGGGILGGLASPKFLALLPLASPRVVGEFAVALGMARDKANVLAAMAKSSAIGKAGAKIAPFIPPSFLAANQVGRIKNQQGARK